MLEALQVVNFNFNYQEATKIFKGVEMDSSPKG
jgi:hypothetical protein